MRIGIISTLAGGALLLAGGMAGTQARPGSAALMEAPCALTAADACRAQSDDALAKGQSVQLVILRGCQAEFKAAAPQGADAIDAAKDRVTACLGLAVHGGTAAPDADLVRGQQVLRKRPELVKLDTPNFAASLRARLTAADTVCARIKHKYTRYNCYTKRLGDLYAAP